MLRSTTLLSIALAGGISLGLFAVSYQVRDVENQIADVERGILNERQTIHVLKAEWADLNNPDRLRRLAAKDLNLQPLKPDQLGRFADLPIRHAATVAQDVPPPSKSFSSQIAAALKGAREGK